MISIDPIILIINYRKLLNILNSELYVISLVPLQIK